MTRNLGGRTGLGAHKLVRRWCARRKMRANKLPAHDSAPKIWAQITYEHTNHPNPPQLEGVSPRDGGGFGWFVCDVGCYLGWDLGWDR